MVKDSTREKNRTKSLLRFHGIDIPEQFTCNNLDLIKQIVYLGM